MKNLQKHNDICELIKTLLRSHTLQHPEEFFIYADQAHKLGLLDAIDILHIADDVILNLFNQIVEFQNKNYNNKKSGGKKNG